MSAFICGEYIIMSLDNLLESIPAYAKDIKLNLSSVLRQTELNPQQLWGTALGLCVRIPESHRTERDLRGIASSYDRAGRRRRANGRIDHVDE